MLARHKYNNPSLFIVVSLILAYVPHLYRLPYWISAFCLGCWILFFTVNLMGWNPPGRLYRYLLTLLALGLVIIFISQTADQRAGLALLAVMLAVKPLEISTPRDQIFTLFLGLFFLFSVVLFSQTLLMALYVFLVFWFFLASLFCIQQERTSILLVFRQSGIILLQSLPIAIILFLIFPRLPGKLVGFRQEDRQAVSGLSSSMNPGSISKLAMSDQIAFRAKFLGDPPASGERYWRALILRDYNGEVWTQGEPPGNFTAKLSNKSRSRVYTQILEPSGEKYVPALEMPIVQPSKTVMQPGFVLESDKEANEKVKYRQRSALSYQMRGIGKKQKQHLLQADPDKNPKTGQLCSQLAATSSNKTQVIDKIQDYFRSKEFSYTLEPETLSKANPIDDFLFNTREGFCEHFAQAAAWMLRRADVPSRIVLGYQGGEINPLGDYMIVRNSNAHAWVEAWTETQGWVRVDPTLMVAPQRIESGVLPELTSGSSAGDSNSTAFNRWSNTWYQAKLFWDSLNYQWYNWIVDYTASKQIDLFTRLTPGKDIKRAILYVFFSSLGAILLFLVILTYFWIR
ncbi:MAG: transglutaminaseTgpA domain-containing protein, partial [Thermodesulfobacteriota bacterium]